MGAFVEKPLGACEPPPAQPDLPVPLGLPVAPVNSDVGKGGEPNRDVVTVRCIRRLETPEIFGKDLYAGGG